VDSLLAKRVAQAIRRYAIFDPGERVLVAVSGGPDSLALLDLLHELAPVFALSLRVAHFDHGWRPGSEDDARFVEALGERYGYPVTTGRAAPDVPHTEDAARTARYAFLRETARAAGSAVIATGHTRDDQVETLLLHLLRGSGTHGLAAMRHRAGDLARPLLQISRAEVAAHLRGRNLTALSDPTNADLRHPRNRLRRTVLPALDAFRPQARRLLARAAEILAEEDQYLEQEIATTFTTEILEDRTRFAAQPPPIQRRLIRRLLPELGFEQVEALRALVVSGRQGQRLSLPGHQTAQVVDQRIEILPPSGAATRSAALPQLAVRRCDCDPATFAARDRVGHVDAATVSLPLTVSTRAPGDRLQPLGFPHRKKLQDVLVDARVPRHLRQSLPIIRDQQGIVWVPGVTVAEPRRVTPATTDQLHLELRAD